MSGFFDFLNNDIKKVSRRDRPFAKTNFMMMAGCLFMIVLGFILMSGGGSDDPNVFNPEIFSTRRIVVGPTITFLGFLLMAFAIIWTPRGERDRTGRETDHSVDEKSENNNPA